MRSTDVGGWKRPKACNDLTVRVEIMFEFTKSLPLSNLSWEGEAEADLVVGQGREEVAKGVEQAS